MRPRCPEKGRLQLVQGGNDRGEDLHRPSKSQADMHHSYPNGILVSDLGGQHREPVLHLCGMRVEGVKHLESIHSRTLVRRTPRAEESLVLFVLSRPLRARATSGLFAVLNGRVASLGDRKAGVAKAAAILEKGATL
jgi:hypothetical protein